MYGGEGNVQRLKTAAEHLMPHNATQLQGLRSVSAYWSQLGWNKHRVEIVLQALFNVLSTWESEIMASTKGSKSSQANWNDIEFVNVKLTEDQKTQFTAWAQKPPTPITDLIGQSMVNLYRISCGWDDSNQCFIATITGKKEAKFNASRSMSSRSDDWYEALALCMFKHYVLFGERTWQGETDRNNWG